jgi:hypothetical protein
LEDNASDLTESSTAMINKRNIIVNVKVNITVQEIEIEIEKENKVLDFSVVTKRHEFYRILTSYNVRIIEVFECTRA